MLNSDIAARRSDAISRGVGVTTQVYAERYGTRIRPSADAEPVTARMRAQQGIPKNQARS